MKVSLLDAAHPGVFARYLPDPLPPAGAGIRQGLALHEGDTAWGAALVEVGNRTVDILSLRYDGNAPMATCERALTETLVQNAKGSTIQELVYVYQGDKTALEAMDDRMLLAGYFPRAGSAQPMEAVLEDLLQNPAVKRLMQLRTHLGVVPIEDGVLLRFYNRTHPATAIHPGELDPLTSRCYVEGGAIKAVLHTRRQRGDLSLEWFANASTKKEVAGWLLGAALAAAKDYPPETRIVLGALPGPSVQIAEKLGFTPVSGSSATRIYTYYL
ncbi:MAG: hypothetical protein HFE97_11855 [Oscillospiraceae bacterium]|nr:hypothetical protein [Oscillospiraceae bacterium]